VNSAVSIDLFGCDKDRAGDLEILRSICRTVVQLLHCTEQKCLAFYREKSENTPVGGVTVFVGMKEGNISMYADTTTRRISFDIVLFAPGKLQPAVAYIVNQFIFSSKRIAYNDRTEEAVPNDSD